MPLTYKQAGVDIDAGDELVERIKPLAAADAHRRGRRATSAASRGSAACPAGIEEPVLVSGTDGVGTKLKVAFATGVHDTIGFDLVGMCVNDVVTCGARPLFFLDYFAHRQARRRRRRERSSRGIAAACKESRLRAARRRDGRAARACTPPGEYDLAGFAVGVVARNEDRRRHARRRRATWRSALPSSGLHSNGYSLARKALLERDAARARRPPRRARRPDASARRCSRRRASTRAPSQALLGAGSTCAR